MPEHLDDHAAQLHAALDGVVAATPRLERWGRHLAAVLPSGARLLTCGNGGSAAEAQHLTGELVGRFEGERMPLSAIALHAETSSATAIANDYGLDEIFARRSAPMPAPATCCSACPRVAAVRTSSPQPRRPTSWVSRRGP